MVFQQQLIKEREANVRRNIEKRSLLPRLIYLSIQCASSVSVRDNIEANGSVSDPKTFLELKFLLERYAKFLGLPFNDAVEVVVGVSSSQTSSEAFKSNMIDWLNFAVFFNAWNLGGREVGQPDGDGCRNGTWHIVDSLLQKCILEVVRSMGLLTCSYGVDLSNLVQLVTEPLAWHSLVIRSCARSSVPSGKKKKKGGPADHSMTPISLAIRASIQSLCGTVEEVTQWLREQVSRLEDENLETIISSLHKKGQDEGSGEVFKTLEALVSSANDAELGGRITQTLNSWSFVDVARKIVVGQCKVLSEFLRICESKLKSLQALKQQILLFQV